MDMVQNYQSFIKKNPKKSFHYRGDVLSYRLLGEGERIIVLLAGSSMFSSDAYFLLQEQLSSHTQVLTIEDISMKISIERIIDSISYLIKLLGFKKVTFLGMGHGGGLAQAFARDHASQTESLILYNTLTSPKEHSDISQGAIDNVLRTIEELKDLRKVMPLNAIKQALMDQIEQVIPDDDLIELFQMLISKYTETNERQQMEIIKDLLTNYHFEKSDFKYLNYRSLIFYGYDEDPMGGGELIESLVDIMTNPKLKYVDIDRFQLIINPKSVTDAVVEFMESYKKKSAL
jgi:pimeloyl-ACP methyl ester carboxylesterase